MSYTNIRTIPRAAALLLAGWLLSPTALAVPSYAQQTGLPCTSCHTIAFGPGLTPFGQDFKLNGYVWNGGKSDLPPVAAMVISSFTHTEAAQDGGAAPHFSPNDNGAVDQTSLFYAGRILEHLGAFAQFTYDGVAQRLHWDNLDLRYADKGKLGGTELVWGATLNNNPTVQDLWNTTPAWSYPYVSSALAPTPAAAPLIEGSLAQEVYGLTAYTMIANHYYIEGGAYRSLPDRALSVLGVGAGSVNRFHGVAPYWRLAYRFKQGPSYGSIGAFGIDVHQYPGSDPSAGTDRYADLGFDAVYGYTRGRHGFLLQATQVHEVQKLPASLATGVVGQGSNELNSTRINAQYTWSQTYAFSAALFRVYGGSDPTLYAPGAISGSASGSPDSRGYITQVEYVPFGKARSWLRPWVNLRLGLQYVYYTEFNGGGANYDGSGRSAHDNNTLYLFAWLAI
ncbi:MAG: hypothetical protein P4L83_09065 [Nevskia sp.]|nr:hypothetical protein [Nevskia sp.]